MEEKVAERDLNVAEDWNRNTMAQQNSCSVSTLTRVRGVTNVGIGMQMTDIAPLFLRDIASTLCANKCVFMTNISS